MVVRGTFPGFDGLRLFMAVSVVFSHAFLIATGTEDTEPFVRLLGPNNILGLYGVFSFFIISGFLLTRSLQSNSSAITYSVNRTLRILPGFLFCTFITVAVIGPLFTTLPVNEYFSSPETAEYVKRTLSTLDDTGLPGVYGGPEGDVTTVVNGSLWSLHYEALSYVLLLVAWTIAPSGWRTALSVVTLSTLIWISPMVAVEFKSVAYTLPYFSGGVLMHWIHGRYGTTRLGAAISLVLLVVSCVFGVQKYAFAVFGAYLIVFFGERPNIGSSIARRIGDCSYGIYLYGWPAEQMVRRLTGTTDPWYLFAMALPLTVLLGWISFHAVEKPAMRQRTVVANKVRLFANRVFHALHSPRAGVLGAKVSFVVCAIALLTAEVQWWYFAESMGLLILVVMAGSVLFMVGHRAVVKPLLGRGA